MHERAPDTIVAMFAERVAIDHDRIAIHVHRGGQWVPRTWGEVAYDVRRVAAALVDLGVRPGDRVLQFSPNRYEWIVTDLAVQWARGVHVPVHASLAGPQVLYQMIDSGAGVAIFAGGEHLGRLADCRAEVPTDVVFVSHDATAPPWPGANCRALADLMTEVDDARAADVERRAVAETTADDLATIIYTSGTTGEPKGVMLTQGNLRSNAVDTCAIFEQRRDDRRISWLPLSHIFARTCDLYIWIHRGYELALADSPESLIANCGELQPTLLSGVPYFFEKVMRTLVEKGLADQPGVLPNLFGGRMRICMSGGAPLPDHVAEFYNRRGVRLVQGYGLTETSPVIATGTATQWKPGTVGRPIPNVEVGIADDGEIAVRGPHVMRGYWNKPQATAQVLREGWFHTGDLGVIDDEGYLRITGRKKDLIVTAGGKNIAPAYLEGLLTADPLIEQVVVVGDARNYLVALVVPNAAAVRTAIDDSATPPRSLAELALDERVRALVAERIAARLSVVSRYEQVCKFALLGSAFSVDRGELTPSLKLRRQQIAANYAAEIAALYA